MKIYENKINIDKIPIGDKMNYKEIIDTLKDIIFNVLLMLFTISMTMIYAFSLMLISILVLVSIGLFRIFGFIKNRLFDQNNSQKLVNI